MMKRALAVILAAGFVVGVYATDARVRVMGRQETPYFYRDEVSVFTNPADMSLYPNLIYGSFGWMGANDTSGGNGKLQNVQPLDPLFGGMISYGFSDEESGPMLSIGAYVNRTDYMLEKLLKAGGTDKRYKYENPESVTGEDQTLGTEGKNNLSAPLGKFDLMLGFDVGNGFAMGLGFYTAYQCEREDGEIRNQTALYKATAGINYNIEQGLDLEASVNGGLTNARWTKDKRNGEDVTLADALKDSLQVIVSDNDYFVRGDLRFFTAVPAINGSFVPQVSLTYMTLNRADIVDVAGGVGINMNIDRGFFWAGLQGIYTQENSQKNVGTSGDPQRIGARLSFGIERNIVWDWFLIRVGGQKEFQYETKNGDTRSSWLENPTSNGEDNDLVGLGFGINIDNRLRIDFVASEDLPYTLTNLISGSSYHLFNRVSATYRF